MKSKRYEARLTYRVLQNGKVAVVVCELTRTQTVKRGTVLYMGEFNSMKEAINAIYPKDGAQVKIQVAY